MFEERQSGFGEQMRGICKDGLYTWKPLVTSIQNNLENLLSDGEAKEVVEGDRGQVQQHEEEERGRFSNFFKRFDGIFMIKVAVLSWQRHVVKKN